MGAIPERPQPVLKAMDDAEARVNRTNFDVSAANRAAIKVAEKAITDKIAGYKSSGVYEDVKDEFKAASHVVLARTREGAEIMAETPEQLFGTLVARFERMVVVENAAAGERLNSLAANTVAQLTELGRELNVAKADLTKRTGAYEEAVQPIAEALYKPKDVADTLESLSRITGDAMVAGKLTKYIGAAGVPGENDAMFDLLTKPENSRKLHAVMPEFQALTGIRLDEVTQQISSSLERVRQKALYMGDKTAMRKMALEAFLNALSLAKAANDLMTNILFNPKHAEELAHPQETHESGGEMLSEEEMKFMLSMFLEGSKDKNFAEQLFDATSAYEYWTDVKPENLNGAQKFVLAYTQGTLNAGIGLGGLIAHPIDALNGLAHAAHGIFNPETQQKIVQMAQYGWAHSSKGEKAIFMTQLAAEFAVSSVVMGAALHKMGVVGKLTKVATARGLGSAAETFAMLANPLLRQAPRLAKYGAAAAEITEGLVQRATILTTKLETLFPNVAKVLHPEQLAHRGHQAVEVEHKAASPAHAVHEALSPNSPLMDQITRLQLDMETATAQGEKLGFTVEELHQIQTAAAQLKIAA